LTNKIMIANVCKTYRDGYQEVGTMKGPFRAVVSQTAHSQFGAQLGTKLVTWVVVNSPTESVCVPVGGTLEMWVADENDA
jgi:hypothetical protein